MFWLTPWKAPILPRLAPDFWAFRHRVVEFVSQRSPAGTKLPAAVLLWDTQTVVEIFDSPQAGIGRGQGARWQGCRELWSPYRALLELYYSIGYLHWVAGDLERAVAALQAGLDLAADHEMPELKSRLLNRSGHRAL